MFTCLLARRSLVISGAVDSVHTCNLFSFNKNDHNNHDDSNKDLRR